MNSDPYQKLMFDCFADLVNSILQRDQSQLGGALHQHVLFANLFVNVADTTVERDDEGTINFKYKPKGNPEPLRGVMESLWSSNQRFNDQLFVSAFAGFDGFLKQLLDQIFKDFPDVIPLGKKEVELADLFSSGSLEQYKTRYLREWIENCSYGSYADQIENLEKKFKVKLTADQDLLTEFYHLAEIRHAITHSGGRETKKLGAQSGASDQKVDIKVDRAKLRRVNQVCTEIRAKITWILARHLGKANEQFCKDLDENLLSLCKNLLLVHEYQLANQILKFCVPIQGKTAGDSILHSSLIDWAQAEKFCGGSDVDVEAILARGTWGIAQDEYKVCLAVIRNEFDEVDRLLVSQKTPIISAKEVLYRPLFKEYRSRESFSQIFRKAYKKSPAAAFKIYDSEGGVLAYIGTTAELYLREGLNKHKLPKHFLDEIKKTD